MQSEMEQRLWLDRYYIRQNAIIIVRSPTESQTKSRCQTANTEVNKQATATILKVLLGSLFSFFILIVKTVTTKEQKKES